MNTKINPESYYVLGLNDRPFQAIKQGKKKVEYRTNTKQSPFDFGLIKVGDVIQFVNETNGDKLEVRVNRVSHYRTTRDLFKSEGLANSSSNPKTIDEAIESLESHTGYKEGIRSFGVWAIGMELINKL